MFFCTALLDNLKLKGEFLRCWEVGLTILLMMLEILAGHQVEFDWGLLLEAFFSFGDLEAGRNKVMQSKACSSLGSDGSCF